MTTPSVELPPHSQSRPSIPEAHPDAPPPKGWRPADDDHSPRAVKWRAALALRLGRQNKRTLGRVVPVVEEIEATLKASDEAWKQRWKVLSRIAWGVGLPVLVGATLGGLALLWRFVSSFHR